jgi:hypothetical protein
MNTLVKASLQDRKVGGKILAQKLKFLMDNACHICDSML